MTEFTVDYLEFNDSDDADSSAYPQMIGDMTAGIIRFGIQPEMYLVAMVEDPGCLPPDVLPAVRQLLNMAYEQGKQVGIALSKQAEKANKGEVN